MNGDRKSGEESHGSKVTVTQFSSPGVSTKSMRYSTKKRDSFEIYNQPSLKTLAKRINEGKDPRMAVSMPWYG